MLKIQSLSKSFSSIPLFDDASFSVNYGERIGLIGRNGHGKSTILKLITGEIEADHGEIIISKDYRIGHLQQILNFREKTILEVACSTLPKSEDGTDLSYQAKTILLGLGFTEEQFSLSPEQLSGGYQIRLNLVKLLVSQPNLLLLDEPTNYLDIVSIRWLRRFLKSWPGEIILITHDQNFMDSVVTHTIGIHRQQLRKIEGSSAKFYDLIATEEEITLKTRAAQLKKREQSEQFINRFRAQASKAKAVQSRIKALEKEKVIEDLIDIQNLQFQFPYKEFKGNQLLQVKNLSFGYQRDQVLINNLSFNVSNGDKIAIIGKNGKGKSTLLNLISKEIESPQDAIKYSNHCALSFFGQTNISRLNTNNNIEEEIAAASPALERSKVRKACGQMMFSGDLAEKSIEVLSGGEKARVLLAKLLVTPANLLLLDEPTNHLDLQSCQALLDAIAEYSGAVIFVSHDEHILSEIANRLIVFDRGTTSIFEGTYQDFLNKQGWQEEDQLEKKDSYSKKEIKELKAQINKDKNKALFPLKKSISKLERKIIKLEEDLAILKAEQADLAKQGFSQELYALSQDIIDLENSIEEEFEELDRESTIYQQQEKIFISKLEELEKV